MRTNSGPSRQIKTLHRLVFLGFSVFLLSFGCKNKLSKPPSEKQEDSVPAAVTIMGSWKTACLPGNKGSDGKFVSRKLEAQISPTSIVFTQREFVDALCLNSKGQVIQHVPYKGVVQNPEGTRMDFGILPRSAGAIPDSKSAALKLADGRACGVGNWTQSQEKNVSGTSCGDLLLDAARYGNFESVAIHNLNEISFGTNPLKYTRQSITPSPQALSLADTTPPDYGFPSNLAELYKQQYSGSTAGLNLTDLGIKPCCSGAGQCDPNAFCGPFNDALRKACEVCKGGEQTCRIGTVWNFKFAESLALQLQSGAPERACSQGSGGSSGTSNGVGSGSGSPVRDAGESLTQEREKAGAASASVNNLLLGAGKEESAQNSGSAQSSPGAQGQQPNTAEDPNQAAAPGKKKLAKEFVAQVVGMVGTTIATGMMFGAATPCSFLCAAGSLAVTIAGQTVIPHVTGQILDFLIPTPAKETKPK